MFTLGFNGIITVNRGDSFSFPLYINCGTNLEPILYNIDSSVVVYFAVMEPNQPFEEALIKKRYTAADCDENGNVIVKFRPKDTQCVLPGKYYYQVKVQRFNSDDPEDYEVDTVVDKTLFWITE
jgi:hypothetical protein